MYSIFMKKKNSPNHSFFSRTIAFKITLFVVFVMFFNILNLPLFISSDISLDTGKKYVLDIENKLGKIYGVVNLPVQIMNDLFKKNMSLSGAGGDEDGSEGSLPFALFVPVKKSAKKSGEALLGNAVIPAGGHWNKLLLRHNSLSPGVLSGYMSYFISHYLASNDIVRYMLLFLMLFLVLPRGIPVRIKKNLNMNFAFPDFIFNKAGNFRLYAESKGSVK